MNQPNKDYALEEAVEVARQLFFAAMKDFKDRQRGTVTNRKRTIQWLKLKSLKP